MKTTAVYPPRAAKALGHLKSRNNDIEIFVEDSSAPNLWTKLLKKYLPVGIRLTSVTVLGPKENVIRACRADQAIDRRRKLYIIDGDLSLAQGMRRPRLRHLYRLRRYCVENYLLDENALVSAIMTLNPAASEQEIRQRMDLNGWLDRNRFVLTALFLCYAVTNELRREEPTVKYSVFRLMKDSERDFDISASKVSHRTIGLYRLVRKSNSSMNTRNAFDRIRGNVRRLDIERFVSAKSYILPSIYKTIQGGFHLNIGLLRFSVLIAECMTAVPDPYLRKRLGQICR